MGPRKQVGPGRGPHALLLPLLLQYAHEQPRAGPLCSQTLGAWWYVSTLEGLMLKLKLQYFGHLMHWNRP